MSVLLCYQAPFHISWFIYLHGWLAAVPVSSHMCSVAHAALLFSSSYLLLIFLLCLCFALSSLSFSHPLALLRRWLYGKTVCSMYAFCGMLFGICSLTTLTLLSMVCFVKVCYPLYGKSSKEQFLPNAMTQA